MSKHVKIFLAIYALLLICHMAGLDWNIKVAVAATAGLLIALAAHTWRGHGTIIVLGLCVHMAIEWSCHAKCWWLYGKREVALHGLHAAFDCIVLLY